MNSKGYLSYLVTYFINRMQKLQKDMKITKLRLFNINIYLFNIYIYINIYLY